MNCKPGDLAVIVRARREESIGVLVHCVRLATSVELMSARVARDHGPVWVLDRPVTHNDGSHKTFAQDANLRPIRAPGITTEEVSELFSPSPAKESEKV